MADTPGILFIVAAPSGAGKSSLVNALLRDDPRIELSISHTTRAPRPGETDGREYHFVDRSRFEQMVAAGDFLEHAEVYGNFYGTSRRAIEHTLAANRDVLLEIDWQGAAQVRRLFPAAVGVFILPPSLAELERRLHARGQDSDEVIRRRMAVASNEIRHAIEFEYAIINKDFSEALADLSTVVRAARLRSIAQRARHPDLFRA
jgi:guanylate kinase